MARWTSKHCTFYYKDASESCSVEVGPGTGEISISNFAAENNREVIDVRDHGALDGRVYGDEVVQEVSITVDLRNQSLTHATEARLVSAFRWEGLFSEGTTTDPGGQVKAGRLYVRLQDEAGNVDWIKLPSVRPMADFATSSEGATLSVNMTNQGQPVVGDLAIPGAA